MSPIARRSPASLAFTLVELMIVIAIIGVLVGILVPVIGKVRQQAHAADTRNWLGQIAAAVERYQQDFHAYPGPLADNEIFAAGYSALTLNTAATGYDTTFKPTKITGTENFVLGLLGGMKYNSAATAIQYDPAQVGLGPMSLNPNNPKRFEPYLEASAAPWLTTSTGLKTGHFVDGAGFADDSNIPDFVDRFPDSMPILCMRAKRGVAVIATAITNTNNSVITYDSADATRIGTYDLHQILAYTGSYTGDATNPVLDTGTPPAAGSRSIGMGKKKFQYQFNSANVAAPDGNLYHGLRTVDVAATLSPTPTNKYDYPYDAFPYFQNPSVPNTAREKESYILISAGVDRVYGTADDIVSFGSVGE